MIDNSNLILPLLNFTDKGDFYFIQIMKRRKDNPGMDRDMHLIDNFFAYSEDDFIKKFYRIESICQLFNARAYIRLNKRNDEKIALQTLKLIAENIANKNYDIKNCYLSACGKFHSDKNKTWVIDIDDLKDSDEIINIIHEISSYIIESIPTKNGIHLITKPFRLDTFQKKFPHISIHKDNPTILFIP